MTAPLVTIGVPAYRGADRLPGLLECIRKQTYKHLDVLISIDNNDVESAEACRPTVERDGRFRLQIQEKRLGWAGNTDWTMRHSRGEFYIYQQHDDLVTPDYVASLVAAAERWPTASVCFAPVQFTGSLTLRTAAPSLLGSTRARALRYLRRLDWAPLRGLIRGTALARTAGLLLSDIAPMDSFGTEHRFLAELALAGEHRLVEGPTYYKSWHGENFSAKRLGWDRSYHIAAQAQFAAWMAEVVPRAGTSEQERRDLLRLAISRFAGPMSQVEWWTFASQGIAPGTPGGTRARAEMQRRLSKLKEWDALSPGVLAPEDLSVAERRSMLEAALAALRDGGRFDPGFLGLDWAALETGFFQAT